MKQRIYIDTSVVGGYFDDEFSANTIQLFDNVKNGLVIIILSDLLEAELLRSPQFVKDLLTAMPESNIERIRLTRDAIELADKYIEANVFDRTIRADCQHIAMATINNEDVLVSWNFKYIVNLDRIRGYHGVNFQLGQKMIEIRTPKEIIKYGTEEE